MSVNKLTFNAKNNSNKFMPDLNLKIKPWKVLKQLSPALNQRKRTDQMIEGDASIHQTNQSIPI